MACVAVRRRGSGLGLEEGEGEEEGKEEGESKGEGESRWRGCGGAGGPFSVVETAKWCWCQGNLL